MADVVKNLSEQIQQVQLQLAEQQATITEQQAINEEQVLHLNELIDDVAQLKAEHKVIDTVNGKCYNFLCIHLAALAGQSFWKFKLCLFNY